MTGISGRSNVGGPEFLLDNEIRIAAKARTDKKRGPLVNRPSSDPDGPKWNACQSKRPDLASSPPSSPPIERRHVALFYNGTVQQGFAKRAEDVIRHNSPRRQGLRLLSQTSSLVPSRSLASVTASSPARLASSRNERDTTRDASAAFRGRAGCWVH